LSLSTMSRSSSKFSSHDGCRLQLHRWGKHGPVCIFLHGFGEGSYIWDDLAPTILPQYQSIVVDLRGHGDSDWDRSRRYHLDAYVKDIDFLIDELRLKCVAIVGHSLGGRVATRIAAARPAEVFAAVLVDSGPELRPEGVARIHADFRESNQVYATIEHYVEWLQQRRILVVREKLLAFAVRSLRRRTDGTFELKADPRIADQTGHPDADAALWKAIAKVNCPTLVLRGAASSVLAHDAAVKTMRAFPKAQLRTIDRAGHGLIAENPKAFADAVRKFLNEAAMSVAA
jgi:esterase